MPPAPRRITPATAPSFQPILRAAAAAFAAISTAAILYFSGFVAWVQDYPRGARIEALLVVAPLFAIAATMFGLFLASFFDRRERAGQVMLALGRTPNTENLGLKAAGVATGPTGEIPVDDYSRTNVENIYAVGDVNLSRGRTRACWRAGTGG